MPQPTTPPFEARRRAQDARRRRNRRTAVSVAIPALITGLALLVLWLGIGRPSSSGDAGGPDVPALGPGTRPPDITIAAAGQVQLRLPVDPARVTAVAFRPADDPGALSLTPSGPLPWEDLGGAGARRSGVDVGARAGTLVYAPVDGRIIAIVPFVLRGRPLGSQYAVKLSNNLGVVVLVSHVEPAVGQTKRAVGDSVRAGATVLGQIPDASSIVRQPISRFSADEGNHVAITVVRLADG